MNKEKSKTWAYIIIILVTIIVDQIIKITIKTNMQYGESICITNWFYITFIENNGMAFGLQIVPKAIQTIARIIFAAIIIWYISILIKANYKSGYVICISLILAGAIGNIIDSIFYGAFFSQSTYTDISSFVPIGHGYSNWLHGRVVDMLYFPLFEFEWPSWMPLIGNNHFIFFSPVFNIADAAISCGTVFLLLFYPHSFHQSFSVFVRKIKHLFIALIPFK